jgi:hypothetical protein
MNTEQGYRFGIIKNDNKDEDDKRKILKRGQIKDDYYECEYCYKTLTKMNYSHHLKRCSAYKKKLENDKKDIILYASGDKKVKSFTKRIELDPDGSKSIEIIPSNKERTVITCIGIGGSGKSYWTNEFLKKWTIEHPGKDIYFFSSLNEDPSITVDVNRVDLKKFYEADDLYMEDFQDSCLVFDDFDCITDAKIRKKLYNFITYMLFTGRHVKATILITLHNPTTKTGDTKVFLNESHIIVSFINGMGNRSINYVFEAYLGMSKKQIDRMRKLGDTSRWVAVVKGAPSIVVSQYQAYANYASESFE